MQVGADGERLTHLLVSIGFADSGSAAVRLIDQGGVRIEGEKVTNRWQKFYADTSPFILQTGKKVVRVRPAGTSSDHPGKGTRKKRSARNRKSEA